MHPKFPLPEDHVYTWGANPRFHDGTVAYEGLWLASAQRALRQRWSCTDITITGRLDLPTQKAVCKVQTTIGHTPNGELDRETWDAIYTYPVK
jgi:hypothetical protein